jgi:pantothenate kinase
MRKMEQIILMQKIENLQNNCLTAIEKSIEGTWAYDFWTNTFDKLEKNYKVIKNGERINDNKF